MSRWKGSWDFGEFQCCGARSASSTVMHVIWSIDTLTKPSIQLHTVIVANTVIPEQHIYTIPSRTPARICIRLYHCSSLHCPHIAYASRVSQVLPSTSLSSLSSPSSSHAEPIRARSQIAVAFTSSLSSFSQGDHQAQACNSTRHPRADASDRCSSSLAVQTRSGSRRLRRHIDHGGICRRGGTIGATERLHAREGRW